MGRQDTYQGNFLLNFYSHLNLDTYKGSFMSVFLSITSLSFLPCRNYVALLSSIESEEWYCGKISRRTAEEYLMGHINARGTFLIRYDSVCAPAHPDV